MGQKTQTRDQIPQHVLERIRHLVEELKSRWFCRSDGCYIVNEIATVVVKLGRGGYVAKFYTCDSATVLKVAIGKDGEVKKIVVET